MNYQITLRKHRLRFKFEAQTSRGSLFEKDTFFVALSDARTQTTGIGECSPLQGLSQEWGENYFEKLTHFCKLFKDAECAEDFLNAPALAAFPSIRFGLEMAWLDFKQGGKRFFFDNSFTKNQPIPINGLIWMDTAAAMRQQIEEKLAAGFRCIKIKVGALDFDQELALLHFVRRRYTAQDVSLRIDANGAFSVSEAKEKLNALARYALHSIEQPIAAGQTAEMAAVCAQSQIPIALDEELIGHYSTEERRALLQTIRPAFIILKPSLLGGFRATQEWIAEAEKQHIGWWITSALESNIGLNALCQLAANYPLALPQGLGTGALYHNNIASPLVVEAGTIRYKQKSKPEWGKEIFNKTTNSQKKV